MNGEAPTISEMTDVLKTIPGFETVASVCLAEPNRQALPDSPITYLSMDRAGRPFGAVQCSPEAAPDVAERTAGRTAAAKAILGDAADVILDPLFRRRLAGRSVVGWPYCRPVRRGGVAAGVARVWHRAGVLRWLRRVQALTRHSPSREQLLASFVRPLHDFSRFPGLPSRAAAAAAEAADAAASGAWQPCFVLMHGDLHIGNVLVAPRPLLRSLKGGRSFVVIDWAGSREHGYPFFDLICFAMSVGLRVAALRREIFAHGRILGCSAKDARRALLAALAGLAANLEQFPPSRFLALADQALEKFDSSQTVPVEA